MNVKETLNITSQELMKTGSPDAKLEAEVLLRHVLKIDRATMFSELEENLSEEKRGEIEERRRRRPRGGHTTQKSHWGVTKVFPRSTYMSFYVPAPLTPIDSSNQLFVWQSAPK